MITSEAKKQTIKNSLQETRMKRTKQVCKVLDLKVVDNKLNLLERQQLKMFFVEAKWLYNYILSLDKPFEYNYQTNPIFKMNKQGTLEEVRLQYLSAKNRQNVVFILQQNIKSLAASKKHKRKVGKLKFTSSYRSIELSQYGITHKIVSKNRIKINGIKRPLWVLGLEQITPEMEIANAKLMNLSDGYHIKLTIFFYPKEMHNNETKPNVGLDFGITRNITTSDGEFFSCYVDESERLKRLQHRVAKSKKGSNNRYERRLLMQREYQKLNNRKVDKANKLVNYLLTKYNHTVIQDENLLGWKSSRFGKQVQHSYMGIVKTKLIRSDRTIVINRFLPTTKLCPNCGTIHDEITLSDRWFTCDCGYNEDRDIKSAKTILKIGMEHTEYKPVECNISTLETSKPTLKQVCTVKQEAPSL